MATFPFNINLIRGGFLKPYIFRALVSVHSLYNTVKCRYALNYSRVIFPCRELFSFGKRIRLS